jgi:hypothetical protein
MPRELEKMAGAKKQAVDQTSDDDDGSLTSYDKKVSAAS